MKFIQKIADAFNTLNKRITDVEFDSGARATRELGIASMTGDMVTLKKMFGKTRVIGINYAAELALFNGAFYGHRTVVEFMLSIGTSPNAECGSKSAEVVAHENGHEDIVNLLQQHKKNNPIDADLRVVEKTPETTQLKDG